MKGFFFTSIFSFSMLWKIKYPISFCWNISCESRPQGGSGKVVKKLFTISEGTHGTMHMEEAKTL